MPVVLTVDPRSGVPIYLQVIEQVKRSVALGVLAAGEQLPTVKQLALDLTINPNTVAKAYRELERDGVIETAAGRGSFVRGNGSIETTKTAATDVARDAIRSRRPRSQVDWLARRRNPFTSKRSHRPLVPGGRMSTISIKNLRKTYGPYVAVDDLSFEIPEACVFGLLGPNGAGKTTTFKCMLDLARPTSGTRAIRRRAARSGDA